MTVIVDISVPADQFALGRLLDEHPDIAIELVRVIPLRDGVIPLFWVEGADPGAIEATIRADPMVASVQCLSAADDRYLFEIRWKPTINALVRPMIESGAEVLIAEGEVDSWAFRLQFESRAMLADFRESCRENDVQFHLDALYNPTIPEAEADGDDLTSEQYEILVTAYENGYWHVPRNVELGEVADRVGISSNAASQRMRRALDTLVGQVVARGADTTGESRHAEWEGGVERGSDAGSFPPSG